MCIVHWEDPKGTGAKAWLVIDRLINGVSGGGVFMHPQATLHEVQDLAHTMSFKNTLTQPQLGGAKAGICFDARDPQAQGVLERFLYDQKEYIEDYWYTGADLNTDNHTILKIVKEKLQLPSSFISLAKALKRTLHITPHIENINQLIAEPANEFFQIYGCATGFSVAECVHFFAPRHPRIAIQGFGAVGSSMAYYMQKYNRGVIVAICDHTGWISHKKTIDVAEILREKENKNLRGSSSLEDILSSELKEKYQYQARKDQDNDAYLCQFLQGIQADVFTPCANRYVLSQSVLEVLANFTFSQLSKTQERPLIVSGANNAFPDQKSFDHMKKLNFNMPPEWVSNCGNAVLFVEAVKTSLKGKKWAEAAFKAIRHAIIDTIYLAQKQMKENPQHIYDAILAIAEQKINQQSELSSYKHFQLQPKLQFNFLQSDI